MFSYFSAAVDKDVANGQKFLDMFVDRLRT